ncbi:tyrosine-type recombinase/integrase [Nocardia shimofusensis]|uniref:tyrosine-type recombinase/integrase n=1 Tax=Nocardia shimofusensis TaxID=228596 RepID=UPI000833E225|nr:site-specific integrase [Nocardia shimofusensis]
MTSPEAAEELAQALSAVGLTVIRMGSTQAPPAIPTFSEYIAKASTAATPVQRESYRTYWRVTEQAWAARRLNEVTPIEISGLMNDHKQRAVRRSNWREGCGAARNLLHAIRCLYSYAEQDGLIRPSANPARKVKMPRRLESPRHALTPEQISDLGRVACETGDDVELDALIVRLHIETACRRGAVLRLSINDLSTDDSTVRLHHKGDVITWHPITPMLMRRLHKHFEHRGGTSAEAGDQVLRTRRGNPIGDRRYDNLHERFHTYLPWAAAKQVTSHWLRHTTLTFVEREFGEAVARRYAAHRDPGTTATPTYTKASLPECALALEAVTGQPHPLARRDVWNAAGSLE